MYILKYQDIEVSITDAEFRKLYRWYVRGFRPRREYEEFADSIYEKVQPKTTKARFREWLIEAIRRGAFEFRPEIPMVRVQYAVLYYAVEETKRTPNPFMEARAWAIVPQNEVGRVAKVVEREAWFIPMLFASIYDAWFKGSISDVESGIDTQIVAVREGYEEREVHEREIGLQRGVAFYRVYSTGACDTWDSPARFFDEYLIRRFEEILFPCVLEAEGFETEEEFKQEVANMHKRASQLLADGDLEGALALIGTIQVWMAECGVLYAPVRWL